MKYIVDDYLYLGSKENEINNNFTWLMRYLYREFVLDYDKMKKIYGHIESDNNYDDIYNDNNIRDILYFEPNLMDDDKYIYKYENNINLDNDIDDIVFYEEIKNLILELQVYLSEKTTKRLRVMGITKLKLVNDFGINKYVGGIRDLDWKLHFWPEYTIVNDNYITLHELIIACFKIKSHKFETYHEYFMKFDEFHVFSCVKKKDGLNTMCKEIIAFVNFNHYSSL